MPAPVVALQWLKESKNGEAKRGAERQEEEDELCVGDERK
jgi:hypothetical protein